jgi:tetratricopeptide (TPR) repeat protein
MSESLAPASVLQRATALGLAGIVLLLCATAVGYRFLHPDLLTPLPPPTENAAPHAPAGMMNERVVGFMQQLQVDPDDMPALLGLTEHFLHLQDWKSAERFARRAATVTPDDIRSHYLLSMALHGLERNEEAAASLERLLQLKEETALRYSLAILYAHYLNDKQKAIAHLRRGLADPAAPDRLKADLAEELAKLEQ